MFYFNNSLAINLYILIIVNNLIINNTMEIRKDIIWYEWLYQVSNLGNVKSLDRLITYKDWRKTLYYSKDVKKHITYAWYLCVYLHMKWKQKWFRIHRLVASSFLLNKENKEQVNHIDWNRMNNNLQNLERCTCSENHKHSFRELWRVSHFQWKKWILSPHSKQIRQTTLDWLFIKDWGSMREIERELGIFSSSMSVFCSWKHKSDTLWWYCRTII